MNRVNVSRLQIAASRRLIPLEMAETLKLDEYFSPVLETRVIEMPESMMDLHYELSEARIALPRVIDVREHRALLQIPSGTQTMQQILKSMSTDTQRYGGLFKGIGIQLHRAQEIQYGIQKNSGRSLLGGIAFTPIEKGKLEDSLFFLPPYSFAKGVEIGESSHTIAKELQASGHFEEQRAKMNELLFELLLGIGAESSHDEV